MKPLISIIQDTRYANKDGQYAVKVCITFRVPDGSKTSFIRRHYGQNFRCTVKEFGDILGTPRTQNVRDLKRGINTIYAKAKDIIDKNDDLTPEIFESLFDGIARDTINGVHQIKIDELLDTKPARVGSARSYRTGLHSFERYVLHLKWVKDKPTVDEKLVPEDKWIDKQMKAGGVTIRFPELTVKWLIGYEEWMIETGSAVNTIGVYLRNLRHIFNMARGKVRGRGEKKLRLIPLDMYPFDQYQIKEEEKYKIPLDDKELEKLKAFDAKDVEVKQVAAEMKEAHDYWMFSYYCNGMNMGDVTRLKRSNVEDEFLYYSRTKIRTTRRKLRPIIIPLNDQIKAIIKRRGAPTLDPNGYLFPILELGLTEAQIKDRIGDFIKRINAGLALIRTKLGISKKFTTVIARHTYANRILNATDGDTRMIQEGLGHSNAKTSEHYKGSLYLEKVKKAREAL